MQDLTPSILQKKRGLSPFFHKINSMNISNKNRNQSRLVQLLVSAASYGLECFIALRPAMFHRLVCPITFMLACFSFIVFANDESINKIYTNQFEYIYKKHPVEDKKTNEIMYNNGEIIITNKKNNKIIYKEITLLQPGLCEGYPAISKLNLSVASSQYTGGEPEKTFVVFCGSSGGRHMMLKIFFEAFEGIRVTTLDFNDTPPNLKKVDNTFISVTHRRLFFDDIGYSEIPYMYVYTLNIDSAIFGFSPAFGGIVEKNYLEYYELFLNKIYERNDVYYGPTLAALYATKNKKYICQQYQKINKIIGIASINEWNKRLKLANFPVFDVKTCRSK